MGWNFCELQHLLISRGRTSKINRINQLPSFLQVAITFFAVVVSTVNFLEVTPVSHIICRWNREDVLNRVDVSILFPSPAIFPWQYIDIHRV